MIHDCGEEMEYLGDEDDGTPIYRCYGCGVTICGDRGSHEHLVDWMRKIYAN